MGEAQDRFRFHGRYPWKWGGVVHGVPCQRHGLSHKVISKNKNRTEQVALISFRAKTKEILEISVMCL